MAAFLNTAILKFLVQNLGSGLHVKKHKMHYIAWPNTMNHEENMALSGFCWRFW